MSFPLLGPCGPPASGSTVAPVSENLSLNRRAYVYFTQYYQKKKLFYTTNLISFIKKKKKKIKRI